MGTFEQNTGGREGAAWPPGDTAFQAEGAASARLVFGEFEEMPGGACGEGRVMLVLIILMKVTTRKNYILSNPSYVHRSISFYLFMYLF